MRILFALHKIQDLGGIINHTEHLAWGFQQLGHEVSIVQLQHGGLTNRKNYKREDGRFKSVFGIPADQFKGWAFPPEMRVNYEGKGEQTWQFLARKHDLIVWEVPLPSKSVRGERAPWEHLTKVKTPQIFVVHDGNFIRNNFELAHLGVGHQFVAVHPCASGTLSSVSVPHTMIVNPQRMDRQYKHFNWHRRRRVVGSLQTFKAWKRVNVFLQTVPGLRESEQVWLAGGGIMQRYLTSKTKVKRGYEPEIWNRAVKAGMVYHGYVSESDRDDLLQETRLLCDFSWSDNYVQYGAHFNRVLVDALMMGCIPVAHVEMTDHKGFFEASRNYVPLSQDPRQDIDEALCMSKRRAYEYWQEGQRLLKKFDAKKVAKKYLDLI